MLPDIASSGKTGPWQPAQLHQEVSPAHLGEIVVLLAGKDGNIVECTGKFSRKTYSIALHLSNVGRFMKKGYNEKILLTYTKAAVDEYWIRTVGGMQSNRCDAMWLTSYQMQMFIAPTDVNHHTLVPTITPKSSGPFRLNNNELL